MSAAPSAAMNDAPGIQLSISGEVARITLARPARRNALHHAAWSAFAVVCTELGARADIRAVVLTGEGAHFCAGADIHELQTHTDDAAWMRQNQTTIAQALDSYANLPQPTLALIRGSCFGGGAALAASSDFRIATIDSKIAITPARLGLTYRLADTLRIHQLIGPARTREMLLLGREVDAGTALIWGLVNEICELDELESLANACVQSIVALSGASQRGIKTILLKIRDGITHDDDETQQIFRHAFEGDDFRCAVNAFKKR